MATLTVFTPTYNRAYILPESYAALKNQTCKDFVWLIVDDGSQDNTQDLVLKWQEENAISIRYFKTENRGKPSATNLSIDKCDSELWVCLDSDDHLAEDAVEKIVKAYRIIRDDPECGGIVAYKHAINGTVLGGKTFPDQVSYMRDSDIHYVAGIDTDLTRIFKTSVLKEYRNPIFPGEKFIGESYLNELINAKLYIERSVIYYAEYREDGLSAGYLNLHVNNPKGYKLLKEQVMVSPKPLWHQFRGAIMYVAGCMLCADKRIICNSPRKLMTLAAYPFGLLAYYKKYAKLVRMKKAEQGKR